MSSIWFPSRGKFALASGEEANNREKARREVYCPQDYKVRFSSAVKCKKGPQS